MTDDPIYVSTGNTEYMGGTITELFGKDISAGTFKVALSTVRAPAPPAIAWVTPDISTVGPGVYNGGIVPANSQRTLKMFINGSTPLGQYYIWGRVTDNPEIKPVVLDGPFTVA